MNDEKMEAVEPQSNGPTPGMLLRKAREAKGLSLAQVAKNVPLSKKQLEAIENDDYKEFPPALIYARGRLSLYARYIDVSVDEVLQAFDNLGLGRNVKAPAQRVQSNTIVSDHGTPSSVRWLSYGVAFVLLVLVLIWWRSHSGEAYKSPNTPIKSDSANAAPAAPPAANYNGPVNLTIPPSSNAPAPVPPANNAAPMATPDTQPATTPDNSDDRPPQGRDTRFE